MVGPVTKINEFLTATIYTCINCRGYIAEEPTDAHSIVRHAAQLHDEEVSLRDELTAKIAGAQTDIESKLSDLRIALGSASSGNAITQAEAQLRGLALLQKRVDRASPASLATIRAEVAASVAATQSFVQQMQGAGSVVTAEKAALQQASEAARGTVTDFIHDYYDERKFDRFLQFASVEDQEEYRRREDERKHAIDKALAEHTPKSSLRALDLSIEQLKDAGAHGARRSSEFQSTLDKMESSRRELAEQIAAPGAASDHARNEASAPQASGSTVASQIPQAASQQNAPLPADVLARLRAAQVVVADQSQDGHGVAARTGSGFGPPSP
jgi:hypothetical protein